MATVLRPRHRAGIIAKSFGAILAMLMPSSHGSVQKRNDVSLPIRKIVEALNKATILIDKDAQD
jgi:hypothetical protein